MIEEQERTVLRVGGSPAVSFVVEGQAKPTADDVFVPAGIDAAVRAITTQLGGWWINCRDRDSALVDALLAAGATVARRSHLYSRPLCADDVTAPLPLERYAWSSIDRSARELAGLAVAAYPPGHPDHNTTDPAGEEPDLAALLDGSLLGPCIAEASGIFVDLEGQRDSAKLPIVGVIIVNRIPLDPPKGGPWVSELFRHPDRAYAGLGEAALQRCIATLAAAGERSLSLAVTVGNPAERLYRRLGFERASTTVKLEVPGGSHTAPRR